MPQNIMTKWIGTLLVSWLLGAGVAEAQTLSEIEFLLAQGSYKQAQEKAEAYTYTLPTDPKGWQLRARASFARLNRSQVYAPEKYLQDAVFSINEAAQYSLNDESKEQTRRIRGWIMSYLFSRGAQAYQAKKMDSALYYFDYATKANPTDTTALIYASVISEELQLYSKRKVYDSLLTTVPYDQPWPYISLIDYYGVRNRNLERQAYWVGQGKQAFPGNTLLLRAEADLYMDKEEYEEAKNLIIELLNSGERDEQLLASLAYLYELEGDRERSIRFYKEALDVNPDYVNAALNLGSLYYAEAINLLYTSSQLPVKEYAEKGEAMKQEAIGYLRDALPYFELVYEKESNNQEAIEALYNTYTRLGQIKKAETLKAKLQP